MARGFTKSLYDWCIENERQDILDLWDYELNNCNPDEIPHSSNKKYWFKCPKGIHKSELRPIGSITNNKNYSFKCNQCNSFGQYLIDTYGEDAIELYWDYELNKVNPFEIAKCSPKKVWIKCQRNSLHPSYQIKCYSFTNGRRCSVCKESRGERKIREILNTYNINFIPQKEFSNLFGVGDGNLSYDFYLPSQNLLIEYQGQYHDGTASNQSEEDYLKQQEHDKRKREYAEQNGIRLLEIWYWDFDNIETILNENIK